MKYSTIIIFVSLLFGLFENKEQVPQHENPTFEEQVYLQVDRTFYKPGEDIWFSAWVIDRELQTLTTNSDFLHVELINPKGKVEKKLKLLMKNGCTNGDFALSEDAPGGVYKLRAYTLWMKNLGEDNYFEKELTVQKVMLPNLLMKLKFLEKGYGAGQEAIAELDLKTLENKSLDNFKFEYEVMINGKKRKKKSLETDDEGKALIKFELPKKLTSADGVLNVSLAFQGKTESISRTIPITLKDIDLQFFPEGGNWVKDIPAKVAFKAVDRFGKPTDVEGRILDENGKKVASFKSFHDGMGAFNMTALGGKYIAVIDKPSTLNTSYDLPLPLSSAIYFEIAEKDEEKVMLSVYSPKREKVSIVGQIKGHTYYKAIHKLQKGMNKISLSTESMPAGILRLSIYNKEGQGQGERLVFVNKNKLMNIKITTDKEKYLPREKVTMNIKTTDYQGNAVAGNLALSVVNNNLLTFADDKQDNIHSHLLLGSELKGKVHEPRFYFKKDEPKADTALDYLLMTQGWRKFVTIDSSKLTYQVEKAQIKGQILDGNGNALKNRKVWVVGSTDTVYSNSEGYFIFNNLKINNQLTLRTRDIGGYKTDLRITNYVSYFLSHKSLSGKIIDAENKPIATASISFPGTLTKSYSDNSGRFDIAQVEGARHVVINHEEYFSKKVRIDQLNNEAIVLRRISENKTDIIRDSDDVIIFENKKIKILPKPKKEKGKQEVIARIPPKDVPPAPKVVEVLNIVDDMEEPTVEFIPVNNEADENMEINVNIEVEQVEEEDEEQIFCIVEKSPVFPGGENAIKAFLINNINYPVAAREIGIEGKVYVRFMVNKHGQVERTNIARGVHPLLDNEAVRVVNSFPKWRAGEQRGKKVNVWYCVPVNFRLENGRGFKDGYCAQFLVGEDAYTNLPQISQSREFYTPVYNIDEQVEERADFRPTIYWNPQITTDKNGEAEVVFYNSDEISSFKAIAEGVSNEGVTGRGEHTYFTQLPFSVNAKIPEFLTFADELQIPVTLTNNTAKDIAGKLNVGKMEALQLKNFYPEMLTIEAGQSRTIWLEYLVQNIEGKQFFQISFISEGLSDAIKKETEVLPKGFPISLAFSAKELQAKFEFEVGEMIPGSLQANFKAYPNILGDLMSGIESILREPHGCFEQTSSSTYPNLLVLDYMKATGNITASIQQRALKLTDKGYKRLVGFETKENGYEWFGNTPAHEGLSAYGLMEFADMAKVYDGVDRQMVKRTQDWLLKKRDGKGGFAVRGGYDRFGGVTYDLQNAYIIYALSESGYFDYMPEYTKAYEDATQSQNAYKLALLANTAFNIKKPKEAKKLLGIIEKQIETYGFGNLQTKESITQSRGHSLQVETASLYLLALLKAANVDFNKVEKAVKYIANSRRSYGGFGSTQATILALKALTSFTKKNVNGPENGEIELIVNASKPIKRVYNVAKNSPVEINGLEKLIKQGKNKAKVKIEKATKAIPYSFTVKYNASIPPSSGGCILEMNTELSKRKVNMGDLVRMNITIKNKTNEYTPMAIAKIGIPSGLSLQSYQLKELLEKKKVDFLEIFDNYLVLYYTTLKPNEQLTIPLDLKTELPGIFEAPASSVYLYYTNEYKYWVAGERVEIKK